MQAYAHSKNSGALAVLVPLDSQLMKLSKRRGGRARSSNIKPDPNQSHGSTVMRRHSINITFVFNHIENRKTYGKSVLGTKRVFHPQLQILFGTISLRELFSE